MRIALAVANARMTGGAESYLDVLAPRLAEAGHRTALICEYDAPADRRRIGVDQAAPIWCIGESGLKAALEGLKQWQPEVIFSQGLRDAMIEGQLHAIAPTVNFVHDYYGMCVSGAKTFSYPAPVACERPLGLPCLAHFYPHRCGGLNPLTMLRDYRKQTARLEAMRGARAIVTASEHIRLVLLQNGMAESHVHKVGLPVVDSTTTNPLAAREYGGVADKLNGSQTKPWMLSRVVFIGRLEKSKGGALLIDAMVTAAAGLKRKLSLTFVGDGRERGALEAKALSVGGHNPVVEISFTGWMEREAISGVMDQSDLLAIPSLWPEPFGLVGVEAGMRGLPAVAFDAGGITEWLEDGVNGRVVRSRPSRSGDFGAALKACLSAPVEYERLRRGARSRALDFRPERHSEKLMAALHEASRP